MSTPLVSMLDALRGGATVASAVRDGGVRADLAEAMLAEATRLGFVQPAPDCGPCVPRADSLVCAACPLARAVR